MNYNFTHLKPKTSEEITYTFSEMNMHTLFGIWSSGQYSLLYECAAYEELKRRKEMPDGPIKYDILCRMIQKIESNSFWFSVYKFNKLRSK